MNLVSAYLSTIDYQHIGPNPQQIEPKDVTKEAL